VHPAVGLRVSLDVWRKGGGFLLRTFETFFLPSFYIWLRFFWRRLKMSDRYRITKWRDRKTCLYSSSESNPTFIRKDLHMTHKSPSLCASNRRMCHAEGGDRRDSNKCNSQGQYVPSWPWFFGERRTVLAVFASQLTRSHLLFEPQICPNQRSGGRRFERAEKVGLGMTQFRHDIV
jgi:hypothetical protein